MGREGFLRKRIELAGPCVMLNGGVETLGVRQLKPRAETCEFLRVQLLDGFFYIFGGHRNNIALSRREDARRC